MKISILLPYKENYSPSYPGAVSLFVNSVTKESIYRENITIYGSTRYKEKLSSNYINIPLSKEFLKSQSKEYVNKFIADQKLIRPNIIEIHNRPIYIKQLTNLKTNLVLYFHNDPISMDGSRSANERVFLLNTCEKIVFNSEWSKKQFLKNLQNFYHKSKKLLVIHQSINQSKVNIKKKKKIISFGNGNASNKITKILERII